MNTDTLSIKSFSKKSVGIVSVPDLVTQSQHQDQPSGYPDYRDEVMAWTPDPILPGTGDPKDETCGNVTGFACCSTNRDHKRIKFTRNCNRIECPECHGKPLNATARSAAMRIDGYAEALYTAQLDLFGNKVKVRKLPPRHWVVSPPHEVVEKVLQRVRKAQGEDPNKTFVKKFRYEVLKVLEVADLQGGAVIIHPYRIKPEWQEYIQAQVYKGRAKDRWAWVRARADWRDFVYFSPHAHVVAYGSAIPTPKFNELTGWTIRMIRAVKVKNNGYAEYTETGTRGLVYYLLSHAQVVKGRLPISYVGCLSPRAMKHIDTLRDRFPILCVECGADMVFMEKEEKGHMQVIEGVIHWIDEGIEWHPTDRVLQQKIVKKLYRIVEPLQVGISHYAPFEGEGGGG